MGVSDWGGLSTCWCGAVGPSLAGTAGRAARVAASCPALSTGAGCGCTGIGCLGGGRGAVFGSGPDG